ncbi:pimeloyl-ACP methyl ester carboxylesterase [Pseudonocardia hierapolitana]|uniref:Pimeloyl-ACP methyl ester carboxylesterase n=1 Tax=Pseudonocardia hierapolitana TaxID=1128676 RepID=A0A561SWH8_9PSEU|nr:epoxide hydrolase family protein [Pseudonocardia hierapolitana]TWF79217.1 pimeloyl-ACP methyl ester carboxylesterase [Pseudonocardia hierapolitana]
MTFGDEISPFRIDVPQAALDELAAKLDATRWPAPLPGDGWDTGVPTAWLRALADHWRSGYDWRAAEKELNAIPQFSTTIDGQNIHFLHVRSAEPDALPLVLTHGWPGSIVEFLDLIGPLTDPVSHGGDPADAFHVVIPALPGFGFSGPVTDTGWTTNRIARAWAELMRRLGYERFAAQGGDIGSGVSAELGRVAPDRVIGVHVNGSADNLPPLPMPDEERASLTDLERDRVARVEAFMREEFGYIAIQSTRPQTMGYGLVDSPVALLAWIMDKFREWTHPRHVLPDEIVDRDRLLTNVMLYWLTGTAGSAAYVGYAQGGDWEPRANSGVPTGVIVFAHDIGIRRYSEQSATIVRWTDVDRGGHFAALEEPELLVADVRDFFRSLR